MYVSVRRTAQCDVEYSAGERRVDSLGVTEVVAACFERQVFTSSEHNKKKQI